MTTDPVFDPASLLVERAISEYRAGRPVIIKGAHNRVVAGVEDILSRASLFEAISEGHARLLLPPARLRHLGLDRRQPGAVALPYLDLKRIEALALTIGSRIDAPVSLLDHDDEAALELARLALVSPAVIVARLNEEASHAAFMQEVTAGDILSYRAQAASRLQLVSRAPVPLEMAETEFAVFRGGEGMRDQVAIVVGKPDFSEPVPVRLHSACLTGDLFGSLKCDCGDQLRGTVRWMAENGGGILLYLDQEGRGNGIANKIRAYKLQASGWDTYDADEALGFDLDQRRFDFAARMLVLLGVSNVSLMTNNPVKIAAMKAAGLEVASEQRVLGRATRENIAYLASKRDRAGHMIDVEALAACALLKD